MGYRAGIVLLIATAQVPAPPVTGAPDDGTAALNRDAADAAASRTRAIAADQAAYQRDLAAFREAKARNDADRAQAAAAETAYQADRAAYEASLADWQRKVAEVDRANARRRPAPRRDPQPAVATGKPVCRTVTDPPRTGSHRPERRRVCVPAGARR